MKILTDDIKRFLEPWADAQGLPVEAVARAILLDFAARVAASIKTNEGHVPESYLPFILDAESGEHFDHDDLFRALFLRHKEELQKPENEIRAELDALRVTYNQMLDYAERADANLRAIKERQARVRQILEKGREARKHGFEDEIDGLWEQALEALAEASKN